MHYQYIILVIVPALDWDIFFRIGFQLAIMSKTRKITACIFILKSKSNPYH